MKKIFPFLMALLLIASCGKENSNEDLTELAVGVYDGLDGSVFTVNKKDNNTVTIMYEDYSFTNVVMNSKTSFTLNEYSYLDNDYDCYVSIKVSGTGTVSENSISLFITESFEIAEVDEACTTDEFNFNQIRNQNHSGVRRQ
jgi:hypothetical protein